MGRARSHSACEVDSSPRELTWVRVAAPGHGVPPGLWLDRPGGGSSGARALGRGLRASRVRVRLRQGG